MSLPGKLCIGILEEDNPLKSYFRFKPLLVESEGRYIPYAQDGSYPEDGCIRIVPDKNESYHFKARMRRIGLFCVVDLRAHPDNNDKIRPNKNYREGGPELNAYIIYSDVVREPAPQMLFEILPEAAPDIVRPEPHTAEVLLRGETLGEARYAWTPVDGAEGQARLSATDHKCALDAMQVFDLNGFGDETVSFAILPPTAVEKVSDMPEAPAERPKPAPAEPPAQKPAPAAPVEKREAPAPEAEAEKPWLHRDSSVAPPPVDRRLSPAQRVLAAQSGLNPRRGRSLQELIDEKWQHSRLNQLGQPASPIVTGAPVASPVDSAVSAVREVWNQPQLRGELLSSLGGIEEFGASLQECREAARQRDIEQHLETLEERRLALLGEMDHLKAANADLRQQLKQEIRRSEAADLADAVEKTRAAREEQAKCEAQAAEARAAAQDARKAVDALTGEALEQRLRDYALNQHMVERMAQLRGEVVPPAPSIEGATLDDVARRVKARFEAEGFDIDRFDALNLCACAAISPVLFIGGPVGCGKTAAARLLADALGLREAGRFAEFAPGRTPLDADARVEALKRLPDVPAMLLLDDANLYPARDPLRGLGALPAKWRLAATLQDSHSGRPVPASALDKGFVVRLENRADAEWQPRKRAAAAPEAPVSVADVVALPAESVPTACADRMAALRKALADCGVQVSRRALADSWNFCGVMCAALGEQADALRVLDLAVAQRILPGMLASAPIDALRRLPALLEGLPASRALLDQPLPVTI